MLCPVRVLRATEKVGLVYLFLLHVSVWTPAGMSVYCIHAVLEEAGIGH